MGQGREFVSTNTEPAAPKAPEVVTKENVNWAAGIVFAPFARGAYLFIRKSTRSGMIAWPKVLGGVLVLAAITCAVSSTIEPCVQRLAD